MKTTTMHYFWNDISIFNQTSFDFINKSLEKNERCKISKQIAKDTFGSNFDESIKRFAEYQGFEVSTDTDGNFIFNSVPTDSRWIYKNGKWVKE